MTRHLVPLPPTLPADGPARFVEHAGKVHITRSTCAPWRACCGRPIQVRRERLVTLRPQGRPCAECSWQFHTTYVP